MGGGSVVGPSRSDGVMDVSDGMINSTGSE